MRSPRRVVAGLLLAPAAALALLGALAVTSAGGVRWPRRPLAGAVRQPKTAATTVGETG
ncbi:hypothetical protein PV726_26805 [Streptomyces europaeiscabiei]|uniref:hypothetical protein n=1 Tax=Streptomyces europaeiscabiei TaxID=146819 RepID=UPI0029A7872B|nr:hypothetical protein [Streptomyces europaeiscabiei]MDX3693883.1 hypothetical protein [Streptomyces europaeiscabiei]